jgi:hypothetical protein
MAATTTPAVDPFDRILGESGPSLAMRRFGRLAAGVPAPVLLTGETGTGKGVLARAIPAASPRSAAPFIVVNCAGVPDSLFESEFFGHTRGAFTGAHYAHRGVLSTLSRLCCVCHPSMLVRQCQTWSKRCGEGVSTRAHIAVARCCSVGPRRDPRVGPRSR